MARTRWTHSPPRTRDVDWGKMTKRTNESREKHKNDALVMCYVEVENPMRVRGRVEPTLQPVIGHGTWAIMGALRKEYGHVGQFRLVGRILDVDVYAVKVMRRMTRDQMADVGWDTVDKMVAQAIAWDEEDAFEDYRVNETQMANDYGRLLNVWLSL